MPGPRPLSSYDYRWVLGEPPDPQPARAPCRPLPPLAEPTVQPTVTVPSDEPLVAVAHRRVRTIPVYWHAGWPSAQPSTLVRCGTADRLYAAADSLPDRFGLAVLDAWRPLQLQRDIYEAAYADPVLPPGFVSLPSEDDTTPPPHLTGGTVDVTLTCDAYPLRLGTDFDAFVPEAHTGALEREPGVVRDLRRLLFWTMRDAGFVGLDCEWWHFEYGTRRWAAITGAAPIYGPAGPRPALRGAA